MVLKKAKMMKITVKGVFNDEFTNYQDKVDSFSFLIDEDERCSCSLNPKERCLVHQPPKNWTMEKVEEKNICKCKEPDFINVGKGTVKVFYCNKCEKFDF